MPRPISLLAPGCGAAELAVCRLRAAEQAGAGAPPGQGRTAPDAPVCLRARPVSEGAMGGVVGTIDGLAALVEGWSAPTWELLALVAPDDDPRRSEVRGRALECAHLAGRGAVVAYGRAAVQTRLPARLAATEPVPAEARLVHDAVLGAVTADLLGHADRHVLSRPLLEALGS